jgi:phosphoglycolate phosphatase
MKTPRLVIFDVDGTRVDSQGDILASMKAAFGAVGLAVPPRDEVLSIVGLSLPLAMQRLAPEVPEVGHQAMVGAYKARYQSLRRAGGAASSPLFPGMGEVVDRLFRQDHTILGIATGKSRRGVNALLKAHGWDKRFFTIQVADDHPSKPHPSMIQTAMTETGIGPNRTVMIGDTSYDMDMARAARVPGISVGWGYHDRRFLRAAKTHVEEAGKLINAIDRMTGEFG